LLKIRLRRTGAKKQPSYRVVVAESTAPRDGTFLEILGHYNPLTVPTTFVIKEDRVKDWLERGAQPTDRVARLLSSRGLMAAPTYVQTESQAAAVPKPAAAPAVASAPAAEPGASAPAAEPGASAPAAPAEPAAAAPASA
jgi:small subunit ribosomal protein S16